MASTKSETKQPNNAPVISKETDHEPLQIKPFVLPTTATMEEMKAQEIWNNCAVRSAIRGIMGGGVGLALGMFLGSLETPIMQDTMTGRQQLKHMGRRSWGTCKELAVMGLLYSAVECVVEKERAKHDTTNGVVAGCITGGTMSAKGGPKAACLGCASFATISILFDKFIDKHT